MNADCGALYEFWVVASKQSYGWTLEKKNLEKVLHFSYDIQ